MPKPSRKAPERRADLDSAVQELQDIANSDRSVARERGPTARATTAEDAEDAALPAQRAVYERIMGKKTANGRHQMSRADEREHLEEPEAAPTRRGRARAERDEDDEELEEDEHDRADEETDLDDAAEDEDDERASTDRGPGALRRAKDALRRAKISFGNLDEDQILQLGERLAEFQGNADSAIRSKDETIRALTQAVGARADESDDEAPAAADEDLVGAAAGIARSLGLENDGDATKALIEFGKKVRGKPESSTELATLRKTLQGILLGQAKRGLRRNYPGVVSDPQAMERFERRVRAQAKTGDYGDDYQRLFREAALLEFGQPSAKRNGQAPKRASPVTQERTERTRRVIHEGTEDHDRAVFNRIERQSRSRLAVRR